MQIVKTDNEILTNVSEIKVQWYNGVSYIDIYFEDQDVPKTMSISLIRSINEGDPA